ncbi:MAG: STAS domain-containing protein [Treponema sp.]|jgi:anti-anti-sigma factor|nr:STAS domain-containing protein [Treponema sp.]
MTVTKQRAGDKLVISVAGRLDTRTAPDFLTGMASELDTLQNLVLDFDKLDYISSVGLQVLLKVEKKVKAKGGTITLIHVSAEIQEVFEMTGFTGILTIE